MDIEIFKQKAGVIHSNKYNYSKVAAVNSRDKVTIECPEHGEFVQKPYAHLNGSGCFKCAIQKRAEFFKLPLNKFILKADSLHNKKYDYSKVVYNNNRDKVTIGCPEHGEFRQRVLGHLQGYGCYKCAVEERLYTTEDYVKKAILKHGDKYDYSKTVYTHSQKKVTIICPVHGEFEQIANIHLFGSQCPRCVNHNRRLSNSIFTEKADKIHKGRYDYSETDYKGCRHKVIIKCKTHGSFLQTPNSHLSGSGCPYCNSSKGEVAIASILDKHSVAYKREYKLPEMVSRYEYDFFLPDRRLLIEFQGIQHYKAMAYFGGEDGLSQVRQNDKFKKLFARMFKYRLIEFNYKQLEKLSSGQFEELVLGAIAKYR